MLRNIWQWLKQLWQRVFGNSSTPPPEAPPPEPPVSLTDAELEAIFLQLLEGVNQDWGRGRVQGFLIGKNVKDRDLIPWLRRFGAKLQEPPNSYEQRAKRLLLLANLNLGELSQVAGEIGKNLGVQVQQPISNSYGSTDSQDGEAKQAKTLNSDDNSEEADAWFNQGNEQFMRRDFLGAVACYDKAIEIKPDLHEAWYNRGGVLGNLGQLEEAIACYDKAIEIKPDLHEAWYNRGGVLGNLGQLEEAIASYRQALYHKPDFPEAWFNRGVALGNLGQFEEAIACCDQALKLQPDNYQARIFKGAILCDHLQQYEEAIASFDKVIEFKPDFHPAWSNRGVALDNLGQFEEAIASYDQAIEIKPDFPEAWSSRGVALFNLGQLEEAIASYDQAIEIKPDFPEAWSSRGVALFNLGQLEEAIASFDQVIEIKPDDHQAWYNRSVALANLGQLEEAIASFDKALEIKPDDHQAWLMAGQAVGKLSQYQLQFPYLLTLHNPILKQWGYNGKITIYAAGLEQCQQDTHLEGWGRLHHFMGRAHYFQGRRDIRNRHLWREAAKEYNLALQTLTPQAYPELHLEVLQDYLKILFAWKATEKAQQIRRDGTDLFNRLLAECKSPGKKQQLERKFASFRQFTVDIIIQSGEPIAALELAEQGKNTCLSWFLDIDQSPTYSEIQQLLTPTTAIVYWHLSPIALHTFLLTSNAATPRLISSNSPQTETQQAIEHLQRFETWLKTWNEQYNAYRQGKKDEQPQDTTWRDTLPQRLHELSDILQIPYILTQLQNTPIQTLILIPHRDLHRLPLHTFFIDSFTTCYLPSAAIGLLQSSPSSPYTHLVNIESPNSTGFDPLPDAEIESNIIRQLFPTVTSLCDAEATQTEVLKALQTQAQVFHFTGHGTYNSPQPSLSALALSQEDRLTLTDLAELPKKAHKERPLNHYQLATLWACETAITGNETITTEYVGLVSVFLGLGVHQVLSTLWTVEDTSNALLSVEFYRLMVQDSLTPPLALQQAQHWLKTVTNAQLVQWYTQRAEEFTGPGAKYYQRAAKILQTKIAEAKIEPNHCRYEHPYYWAAFALSGNL
ncbi:tetratricopeptide repeat protein [Desertifilum sp. FACHB-1129]|uniref:tetratricopeptide repeat protein n=1 Tax=Desertifilum sp. FACHB-1129 TaxID=2692795 RepID=UPI001681D8EB|nr:tetratricopeptide repeat protein [Desertifilum sp. FACHB-1129]MBD2313865.1 tetratricopeptide repeat protein [Desertifilum sp. FACHB-1129]